MPGASHSAVFDLAQARSPEFANERVQSTTPLAGVAEAEDSPARRHMQLVTAAQRFVRPHTGRPVFGEPFEAVSIAEGSIWNFTFGQLQRLANVPSERSQPELRDRVHSRCFGPR
jgi:hypothetical protein